ncbi:MAG: diguanylate cyclase [Lachnospiraceae bacterium]|nr:diguanylate cyclase [Lachnospiraceae bacterium]
MEKVKVGDTIEKVRSNRSWYFFIAGVVVIFMTVITLSYYSTKDKINEVVRYNAVEVTSVYVQTLTENIKAEKLMIEKIAESLADYSLNGNDKNLAKSALSQLSNTGDFSLVAYADLEGNVISIESGEEINIADNEAFISAKNGRTTVSQYVDNQSPGMNSLLFCTPVKTAIGIKGVAIGCIYSEDIAVILNYASLGDNDLMLIDENMNIYGVSANSSRNPQKNKFDFYLSRYEYEDGGSRDSIIADIKDEGKGAYTYTFGGKELLLAYAPVGINDLYLIKTEKKEDAYEPYKSVRVGIERLYMLFVIVFFVMLACTLILVKHVIKTREKNSKYNMIDNEKKSMTYTYNPTSRAVELSGAVEQTFGPSIASLGTVNIVTLIDMLHQDDQDLVKDITKRAMAGDSKFMTEIRIKDLSGDYCWYKLTGIFVRNSKGNVDKVLGNIQNSNEEIAKEQILRNKAESDLLTGLLNKVTMEDSVDKIIRERPYGIYYFYIVDLDNFKAVNDNLGHSTGDNVLTDVSGKLSRVFSEFDYIGRIGGDEFAVLLVIPENMSNNASNLVEVKAKAICDAIRNTYTDGLVRIEVSASVGISMYKRDGYSYQELYKHADQALYMSKKNGKNQYNFYDKNIDYEKVKYKGERHE